MRQAVWALKWHSAIARWRQPARRPTQLPLKLHFFHPTPKYFPQFSIPFVATCNPYTAAVTGQPSAPMLATPTPLCSKCVTPAPVCAGWGAPSLRNHDIHDMLQSFYQFFYIFTIFINVATYCKPETALGATSQWLPPAPNCRQLLPDHQASCEARCDRVLLGAWPGASHGCASTEVGSSCQLAAHSGGQGSVRTCAAAAVVAGPQGNPSEAKRSVPLFRCQYATCWWRFWPHPDFWCQARCWVAGRGQVLRTLPSPFRLFIAIVPRMPHQPHPKASPLS